jgi:integrase
MASLRKRMFPRGKVRWQVDYRDGRGVPRYRQFTTKREGDSLPLKARAEVLWPPSPASAPLAEAARR